MKQFGTALVVSLAFVLSFEGCQHTKTVQSQPAKPPLAPERTLPEGIPSVSTPVATAFSLRYQDIVVGTGKDAEPAKLYKVNYTGWLAADGHKFDSSYDHKTPVMGKDGKPELDADGKPKMNSSEPITFPQGFGRVIPGFDQGFTGMKVGGKRRLFIPWQLAYGARGRPGPNAENPGIPPKADLIFDIELVDVTDMPTPQGHPMLPRMGATGAPASPAAKPPIPVTPPSAGQANPASTPPAGTPPPADKPQMH